MSTVPLLSDTSYAEVPIISADKQIIKTGFKSFPLCCCSDSENDITNQQYKIYKNFLKECEEDFDSKNERHSEMLKELESIGLNILGNDKSISVWRFLGFQSDKPENDFRAGGIMSVEFMLYVLKNNILTEKDLHQPFFFFALTCIKVLYCTKVFFHLFDSVNMKIFLNKNKYFIGNRRQIKKFCDIDGYDKIFIFSILSALLQHVFQRFRREISYQKKEENYTIIEPLIEGTMVI